MDWRKERLEVRRPIRSSKLNNSGGSKLPESRGSDSLKNFLCFSAGEDIEPQRLRECLGCF